MEYTVYADGACSGNPGPGGYAFIIMNENKDVLLKVSGSKSKATNNQMELTAIVRALVHIRSFENHHRKQTVTIYSDSAYCVNAIEEGWIFTWKKNGWKTKAGREVKNIDLWLELYRFLTSTRMEIQAVKVKGHSGDKYNELVDKAAKEAIRNLNANSAK